MKRAFLVCAASAAFLSWSVMPNARVLANPNRQEKNRIVRQIRASNAVQIFVDNAQGSLLHIQDASVKEISEDDFTTLVGEPPRYSIQSTFPEVTLLNRDSRTIKSFAIIVQSAVENPKSGYVLLKRNLSITPNSTYKVNSSEWPQAERISIQKGGKFATRLRQPGLESARSWIRGAASDLRITVGLVEFEDGSRWKIPPSSNW